jgi:hypothetical protein
MKTLALLVFALVMAAAGVLLARYAEADDAPGGVVMGAGLVVGALALGVKALYRSRPGS